MITKSISSEVHLLERLPWDGSGFLLFLSAVAIHHKPGEPIGRLRNHDTDIFEDNHVYHQYPQKVKDLKA